MRCRSRSRRRGPRRISARRERACRGCAARRFARDARIVKEARAMKLASLLLALLAAGAAAAQSETGTLLAGYANAQYFWQQTEIARQLVASGDRAVIP